ncbi:MAG: triose-phosphate isomerase [Bacteroidia bacterium]|nr:triose-phosphate isomerase [Bacteroidia bacterium]
MRKKIIAGNWKMNKTFEEGLALVTEIIGMTKDEYSGSAKVVLIPPFIHVNAVSKMVAGNANIQAGAQNCSNYDSGAYTGEVSAGMIKSCGASYVIIGHSERRQYFNETNSLLASKTDAVLKNGLTCIYCCGETLEEREANHHFDVLKKQVSEGLFHLTAEQFENVVIAYEPVWAIGTGRNATPEQAEEVHVYIRNLIKELYTAEISENIVIQYGGSVKPDNAKELLNQPNIDGALVGGACLKADSFLKII